MRVSAVKVRVVDAVVSATAINLDALNAVVATKKKTILTSRVSAVNSGRRYLPDNRFMKPVLQNPSIAKQTCILFSCSQSLTRSFHIS